jgi:uncharacterized protein HemX
MSPDSSAQSARSKSAACDSGPWYARLGLEAMGIAKKEGFYALLLLIMIVGLGFGIHYLVTQQMPAQETVRLKVFQESLEMILENNNQRMAEVINHNKELMGHVISNATVRHESLMRTMEAEGDRNRDLIQRIAETQFRVRGFGPQGEVQ